MPEIYISKINLEQEGIDLATGNGHAKAQQIITDFSLTHAKDRQGKVWKFHPKLNRKSVALNHAGEGPQRLTFDRVVSFGTMEEMHSQSGKVVDIPDAETSETTGQKLAKDDKVLDISHAGRSHALLSASGAHRWLNCTPSARLEEQYPDNPSDAAAEGTAAHELAEHKLRQLLDQPSTRPTSEWEDEEMDDYTDDYADRVMSELAQAKQHSPAAFLALEQRLDFSHIVPDGFGTGDAVIVSDELMTIVDLKYGKGVEVSAVGNPQMRLYALGALRQFGMIYDIKTVRMVIYQPRLDNISVDEVTVDELLTWADEVVKPTTAAAQAGEGGLKAGDWCQFCRHQARCTALAAYYLEPLPTSAPPAPETLTDDQIAHIVAMAGDVKKWLTTVESYALDQANSGHTYPGLKLVEGRSVRRYTDEQAVAQAVEQLGLDPWEHKLLGITAMTELLGKKQFDATLGGLLHKPAGKPTLVPLDDKRPALAVTTPETVFTPITAEK